MISSPVLRGSEKPTAPVLAASLTVALALKPVAGAPISFSSRGAALSYDQIGFVVLSTGIAAVAKAWQVNGLSETELDVQEW
jgi:hypothetical protein